MASLLYFSFRKLLLLYLVSFLFSSILVCALSETDPHSRRFLGRRKMLEMEEEDDQPKKKPKSNLSTKNQNKLLKPKPPTNSTKKAAETSTETSILIKAQKKKLNSTSSSLNSTKPKSVSLKKDSDLLKSTNPKNKTSQLIVTKKSQTLTEKKSSEAKSKSQEKLQSIESKSKISGKNQSSTTESKSGSSPSKKQSSIEPKSKSSSSSSSKEKSSESKAKNSDKKQLTEDKNQQQKKSQKPTRPYWMDQEADDDLISEFRDLPSKFHQALIPDLRRISTNSKAYFTKANKEMTNGFKPLVGNKYAPTIASILSCVFIIVPLLLVSLIFNRIKAYFSLQKILIFIQIYLSIYFSILSLSSLLTGLEPLKFFYATSQSSYVWLQVLQTLGYALYLLLLLMYLVLVFSTESGMGSRLLGLGQTMVGVAVGLHYYATVFHRAVLHQPPKTNWKVHGIYAVCFLVICLSASAERRKKAYLHDGGEEGKKS